MKLNNFAPVQIFVNGQPVITSKSAVQFIAYELGQGAVELTKGAISALGFVDEAEEWASTVGRLRRAVEQRDLLDLEKGADSFVAAFTIQQPPEYDAAHALVQELISEARRAWLPIQAIIDACSLAIK